MENSKLIKFFHLLNSVMCFSDATAIGGESQNDGSDYIKLEEHFGLGTVKPAKQST